MKILDIKTAFRKELKSNCLIKEIDVFFYILTEDLLGLKRVDIALTPDIKLKSKEVQFYFDAIEKLKKEVPIQYITGKTEFYGLPFLVNNNVLIPRPETEELVEWVIEEINNIKNPVGPINILDIGTGSGCIAIAISKNIPNAKVWAIEKSEKALKVAKENALLNNVQIQFIKKDIFKINKLPIKFDFIISNPPYVREAEKKTMNNNVLNHEPKLALFVKNENALIFYEKIIDLAKENLVKNGKLFFEINQYLGTETITLIKKSGFHPVVLKKDFLGNNRMIMCQKK